MKKAVKAVSPIMATLILLVIAIVTGLVAWMWISGWLGWQLYQAGIQVKIEDVTVQDGHVHVTIRNTGSSEAVVDRVFIDDLEYDAYAKIQPGDYKELEFPYAWTYGTVIKIKVILESGHTAEWRSPIRVPEVPFALKFDGAGDDYISTSHADDLSLTTFTIECWLKLYTSSPSWFVPIVVKGSGNVKTSCNYGLFQVRESTKVQVAFRREGGGYHYHYCNSNTALELDRWYHVVGIFDGYRLAIYINGLFDSEYTNIKAGPATNTDPLYVGWNTYSDYKVPRTFIIDELRIYNRPLSEDEIRDNIRGKVTTDGLVLWYRFDEGSGASVKDVSGSGHTASFGPSGPSWVDGVEKSDVEHIITGLPVVLVAREAASAPVERGA